MPCCKCSTTTKEVKRETTKMMRRTSSTHILPDTQWLAPNTNKSRESLTRVQNIIGNFDPDHTMKYYDYWSKHYEEDLKNLDYNVPNEVTGCLLKSVPKEQLMNSNFEVLDIGAGTGQMAEALRKTEVFSGTIDALDGNGKMLAKCVEKQMYRHHTIHFLLENNPMPFQNNSYDAVVSCCAMVPGLIQPECLPDMVRLIKAGGTFVFTTRATDGNNEFLDRVNNQLNNMVNLGLIEIFEKKQVPQYSWPVGVEISEECEEIIQHCISALVYGIKKLRDS